MKRVKALAERSLSPLRAYRTARDQYDDLPRLWFVRYVLYRYGHQVAYVILGIAAAGALAWTGYLYAQVDGANERQDRDARRVQRGRVATAKLLCSALNDNSRASHAQASYIKGLIVAGAKSSKVFEPIYRQYGLPAYAERLKQAEAQAAGLDKSLPPILDCGALVTQIRAAVDDVH